MGKGTSLRNGLHKGHCDEPFPPFTPGHIVGKSAACTSVVPCAKHANLQMTFECSSNPWKTRNGWNILSCSRTGVRRIRTNACHSSKRSRCGRTPKSESSIVGKDIWWPFLHWLWRICRSPARWSLHAAGAQQLFQMSLALRMCNC